MTRSACSWTARHTTWIMILDEGGFEIWVRAVHVGDGFDDGNANVDDLQHGL